MKFIICSDIHGDLAGARAAVNAFESEGADKLLILGDVLYHGPRNNLPDAYAPKEVIELLNGYKDSIICVRGNCDAEVDQMVLSFPITSKTAYVYDGEVAMLMTHGHSYTVDNPPPLAAGDVMLCGHTHVPTFLQFGNGNHCINPGSVSIPKGESVRSYIVYEDRRFTLKDCNGNTLYEYEI